jgi:tetratricopeptide (TPR) repeat protein
MTSPATSRIEKTVFISYRRTSVAWALAIYQNLTHRGYDVFFDYEGIGSGDFEHVILENVRGRSHFLVLLTPSALERIGEQGDWLRREIETALESRRNIVPVMLDGFDFGTKAVAEHLTGPLAALMRYNGLPVVASYFEEAMERLVRKHLNTALDAVVHPPSPAAAEAARQQQAVAAAAAPVEERQLTAEQWFERGVFTEDDAEAERCFTEAIRLSPDHALAYYWRGVSRRRRSNFAGAVDDLTVAVRFMPDDADSFWSRGFAREGLGDWLGALADYNEAIQRDPTDATFYRFRAGAREQLKQFDSALEDFAKAIELNPEESSNFYLRGSLRESLGDIPGAVADLTRATVLGPDDATHFRMLGLLHHKSGDIQNAIRHYTKAQRLDPENWQTYAYRARAREIAKDFDGAFQDFESAIGLQPADPDLYYNRGQARRARGLSEEAAQDFQRYLDLGGGIRDGDQAAVEGLILMLRKSGEDGSSGR